VRNFFSASVLPERETFNNTTEYVQERNLLCARSVAGVSVMKTLYKLVHLKTHVVTEVSVNYSHYGNLVTPASRQGSPASMLDTPASPRGSAQATPAYMIELLDLSDGNGIW